uniref:B cell linker n=1 Tax=Cyprinus carpio TaxID=7962 RepID=A0A8C1N4K3_CYPCA
SCNINQFIAALLQKMVQDIKKNDDSLFNRLKRYVIFDVLLHELKHNRRRQLTKLLFKVKFIYISEAPDSDKDSDSDFDSDTYEDPQGEHDDSYEPPPRHEGHMKAFTVSPSITNPRGEYVGEISFSGDYIEPEDERADDNYIDPTGKTPSKPPVNRGAKPCGKSPVLNFLMSLVTESHITCFPGFLFSVNKCFILISRSNTTLQPNTQMAPPKASPRYHTIILYSKQLQTTRLEPKSEDEYEVCDAEDSVNEGPEETTEARRPSYILKLPINNCMIFVIATPIKTTPVTIPRSSPDTMPSPSATGFHRANYQNFMSRRTKLQSPFLLQDASEAGVYKKVWYASSCDRKTAEDALIRSAKDGSFLLRKSSGVDAQQPYTLVVFYNSRVYNIPVRYIASTKQYALGKEKQGEERFSSVSDIVENHQKNPLVLVDSQSNTKDYTKLRHAVKP